ncbi:hypothetical protein MMC11_001912 [Xylographa trunciseda]|nr:hypothetical protein [Xylographa trunciseda]
MAPPPATPSPHRFVTQSRGRPEPKPQSSLRNRYKPDLPVRAQQFAPTPKFSVRPAPSHEDVSASPISSPLVSRARQVWKGQQGDDIDETTEQDSDNDGDDDRYGGMSLDENTGGTALPSEGHQPIRPHKRRHSSPPAADRDAIYISDDAEGNECRDDPGAQLPASGSSSQLGSPTTTHQPLPPATAPHGIPPSTTPRFHLAPPSSTPTPVTLPKFVIPTPAAVEPLAPLPEAFSPHRRGAKYLPSGLAATCRDWVLSASQWGAQTRRLEDGRQGNCMEVEWAARVRVQEVRHGEGMALLRGSVTGERWMLIGGDRSGGADLRRGGVVGVKRPLWEVEVGGEVWGVGVEWSVLEEERGSRRL